MAAGLGGHATWHGHGTPDQTPQAELRPAHAGCDFEKHHPASSQQQNRSQAGISSLASIPIRHEPSVAAPAEHLPGRDLSEGEAWVAANQAKPVSASSASNLHVQQQQILSQPEAQSILQDPACEHWPEGTPGYLTSEQHRPTHASSVVSRGSGHQTGPDWEDRDAHASQLPMLPGRERSQHPLATSWRIAHDVQKPGSGSASLKHGSFRHGGSKATGQQPNAAVSKAEGTAFSNATGTTDVVECCAARGTISFSCHISFQPHDGVAVTGHAVATLLTATAAATAFCIGCRDSSAGKQVAGTGRAVAAPATGKEGRQFYSCAQPPRLHQPATATVIQPLLSKAAHGLSPKAIQNPKGT